MSETEEEGIGAHTLERSKREAIERDKLLESLKSNDAFLLRAPFISIVCIYPDTETKQNAIQDFLAKLPVHNDIEIILAGNYISDEYETYFGWRDDRVTSVMHRVVEFEFDECRNVAKQWARGAWVISLDLDERLLITGNDLVKTLKEVPANVDSLRVTNVSLKTTTKDGLPESHAGLAIRIFKNLDYIKFEGRCHELVDHTVAKTAQSHIVIQHSGYLISQEDLLKKLERNMFLLCKEVVTPCHEKTRATALRYLCLTGKDLAPAFT